MIGNAMLAVAAAIGAQARVPGDGAACARRSGGAARACRPASTSCSALGWTVFELLVIATAAAALSRRAARLPGAVGLDARLRRARARARAARADRRRPPFIRTVAVWAVPLALVYLDLVGARTTPTSAALWHRPGEGGLSVWQGADVVVGDHRLVDPARGRLHALLARRAAAPSGAARRRLPPRRTSWLLGARRGPRPLARTSSTPRRSRRRSPRAELAAVLALLALTVGETDEAFANAYSARRLAAEPRPARAAARARRR